MPSLDDCVDCYPALCTCKDIREGDIVRPKGDPEAYRVKMIDGTGFVGAVDPIGICHIFNYEDLELIEKFVSPNEIHS